MSPEQKRKHREYMREYHRAHPEENRAKVKAWNKKYPDKKRAGNLRAKYGLTVEQYEELRLAQNDSCAICLTTQSGRKGWSVDHCHQTRKVRGLLCANCNFMLGHAKDDPLRLLRGAAYLEKVK